MRLWADAFWLTVDESEEGLSGTGGAAAVEDGVAAVVVAGAGVAAVAAAPGLSQGFGGEAIAMFSVGTDTKEEFGSTGVTSGQKPGSTQRVVVCAIRRGTFADDD